MTWSIYALVDPRTDEVRYIGKANDASIRLRAHLNCVSGGDNLHKCNWIRQLLSLGLVPHMLILERGNEDWSASEKYWISFYRDEVGADLTNMTVGGDGAPGYKWSESDKLLISERMKSFYATPEGRGIKSESTKKSWQVHRESLSAGISKAAKVRANRPDQLKAASDRSKSNWSDPEIRSRMTKNLSEAGKRYWDKVRRAS